MNEKDEERMRWSSTKTIKKNLNTENWIDFNEQFILVIARTNADVETLVKTGKDPVWKKPSQTDTKPIINSNTGLQMRDKHNNLATEPVYSNDADGQEDYKFDASISRKRIQAYKEAIKPCIVILLQHIEDSLLRVMRIDKQRYDNAYENDDLVTLLSMARFASTGQGADSIYGDLVRMSTIKVENGDWIKFTYAFQELRKRILNSNNKKEDIIEKFFDALFIIRSGEGVVALEKHVGDIMCLKEWPSADICMATWNTMLTTKKNLDTRFESEKKEGALSANMTNLQSQVKKLEEQISSYNNPSNELQAHYTKSTGIWTNLTCHNCGKKGHGRRKCLLPISVCADCGENHHTSQHGAIMKVQKRDTNGAVTNKVTNTRQAHVTELRYEYDPEDTEERQNEDARLAYNTDITQLVDIESTAGCYGGGLTNYNVKICEDGIGIEVEGIPSIKANIVTLNEKVKGMCIDNTTSVVIDETEYHLIYDNDDEDVIETIIPGYISTTIVKEEVLKVVEVKKEDSKPVLCGTSNHITKPKRAPPRRPDATSF